MAMMKLFRPTPIFLLLAALLSPVAGLVATAQAGTSEWSKFEGGAVRLVSAGPLADGRYDAAIEFALDPGWYTYWEHAGEAGIPPQADWSQSKGVASTRMQFPYPERHDDGFSVSNIYRDGVVLPVAVVPADAAEPVDLVLDLTFGTCREICVPGHAVLSMKLMPDAAGDKAIGRMIARARAQVPMAAQEGDPVISRLHLRNGNNKEKLDLSLTLPPEMKGDMVEVFAVGPEGTSFGVPRRTKPEWTQATGDWVLALSGLPKDMTTVPLRFVLVSGSHAVEQRFELNRQNGSHTEIHATRPR